MAAQTTIDGPSTLLLDRLTRSEAPVRSERSLRDGLLDGADRLDDIDRRDRDRAAHMLLHLDDPRRVLQLGTDHLTHELGSARADAGLLHPDDDTYRPLVVVADGDDAATVAATPLPNRHPVVRTVWSGPGARSFERVAGNSQLGELEPIFTGLGMTAMLVTPIRFAGTPLGLLCLDETEGRRRFTSAEHERVDRFVGRFLAPVLHAALQRRARRPSALTPAEAAAVRLLAEGHSYASIARALGKSARTIDNQLRAARRKAGAANAVELSRWWQHTHSAG